MIKNAHTPATSSSQHSYNVPNFNTSNQRETIQSTTESEHHIQIQGRVREQNFRELVSA